MLCLTRKRQETVRITIPPSAEPTVVEVTLADIDRNRVRLGFDAPRAVEIMRTELVDRWTVTEGAK